MTIARAVAAVVAAAVLVVGVLALRDATQSTHYETGPDTALRVVVEARSNRSEPTQSLEELTEGRLQFCRLEVTSDLVGEIETLSVEPYRYAAYLRPALDSSDRKQYAGCLEDWILDHHLLDVISMTDIDAAEVPPDD